MKPLRGLRCLSQLRLGIALHDLLAPGLGAKALLGARLDNRARLVARVLGARYLVQTLLSGAAPSGAVLALGAEVDGAHAASMLLLALLDRRRRRQALASFLIAGSFAVAGMRAAWESRRFLLSP